MLLFFYANRELNFDTHHDENIYRLTSDLKQKDGQLFTTATSSVPIAASIQQEIPEVELAVRAANSAMFGGKNTITYKENSWTTEDGFIADTSFFNVLKYDIIQGSQTNPLSHNNAVVLEKEWADKMFGEENPLGKLIKITSDFGDTDFEVTAVFDKKTYNSHLYPSYVVSMANNNWNDFFNKERTNWVGNNMVYTYVKLREESNNQLVMEKVHELLQINGAEQMKAMGVSKTMTLQPVDEIHTSPDYYANVPNTKNAEFIYVLIFIGLIILILACVNYINLSTVQAGRRAMEVGVRKVMGVSKNGLIIQFLGESFIIVLVSLLISIVLVNLMLPFFNQLIDQPLEIAPEHYSLLGQYLLGFLVITGIFSGFYPAFYLASFKPITVLKGKSMDKTGTTLIRKGLVVFQFVISIGLISSILIISEQVNFIQNKDLGFDNKSKIIIPLNTREASEQYEILKQKYNASALVLKVTGCSSVPGSPIGNDLLVYKKGQSMEDAIHIYNNYVDIEYSDVLGLNFISGQNFKDYNKDTTRNKILLTENSIKNLGISLEDAPGEIIYFDWEGITYQHEIVGVISDFHQFSLHQDIDTIMLTIGSGKRYSNMILDANLDNFQSLVSYLETEWKEIIKETPFDYFILNDHLLKQYESDFNTFNLIKYFAFISLVISCLGLYAMSMYMAEKRFKEIGIRKTFGASIQNILIMVSADLSKLIIIAFIISIPISIYGMNKWLDTFSYKITPGLEIYALAGLISLLIGWFTISYQSIRAARTNPVNVLKDE